MFFPFSQNYRVNVASAVNILSATSTSFGGGAGQIDEKLQQQLLEEEEHAMKQFKVKITARWSENYYEKRYTQNSFKIHF